MADPKNPGDQEASHSLAGAKLVSGILDGTYKAMENAQIALARSRQILSKRKSNLSLQPVGSGASEPNP